MERLSIGQPAPPITTDDCVNPDANFASWDNDNMTIESIHEPSTQALPSQEQAGKEASGFCRVNFQFELKNDDCMGTWTLTCSDAGICQQAQLSFTPVLKPGNS